MKRIEIRVWEEVKEIYEVDYDGNMEDFDPIEYMTEKYMTSQKNICSEYEWDVIKTYEEK